MFHIEGLTTNIIHRVLVSMFGLYFTNRNAEYCFHGTLGKSYLNFHYEFNSLIQFNSMFRFFLPLGKLIM